MSKDKQNNDPNNDEKQVINNPNDKFFKAVFSMLVVVQDYFDNLFPKYMKEKLDLSTLELDTTTYITSELGEFYSDIVWRCQMLGSKKTVHVCFIFEHKSYVPDYPNIQIGDYKQGAYNKQLAAKQPLSVVVPIIVYHGKRKWVMKPFHTYFGEVDEAFQEFIDPCKYYLTDLQDYSDEMIVTFNSIFLVKALLAFKHYTEKIFIKSHFAELVFVGYLNINSKETLDFMKTIYVYLSNILGGITKAEVYSQIEQLDNNLNKEDMYNIFEDIEEKGIKLGEKMSIYKAHINGAKIEELSRYFALPAAEILKIIEEMKKRQSSNGAN
jgi:predicted transposase/invertase (TIGR01784 family)